MYKGEDFSLWISPNLSPLGEGEFMSLNAIQKVTEAEQSAQAGKAEAIAAAKKLVADAQRAGDALVEQARAKAEAENKALLRQAEERAAKAAEATLEQARQEAQAMCRAAEGRLDQAADLIVGRVVKQ